MEYRNIGLSGTKASVVGLGGWAIGGWFWGGTNESEAIKAIHASLDAGITLIDTAPAYGLGLSEEIIGKAIVGRRDKVLLATKCGLVWHTQKGEYFFNQKDKPVYRYLGKESIRYEIEQSLKLLKTDYIDLYQTHWQDSTTPITETMETLLDLKREGKIRAVGVSNINLKQLKEYQLIGIIDSAQEKYNMLDRELEETILPYCREQNISILSYSSLATGLLTGKIVPERKFFGDDQRKNNDRFSSKNLKLVAKMINEFRPIAEGHKITIAQLVIAWTICQPGITFALCGVRNPKQAKENAHAGNVVLTEEEKAIINDIIAKHANRIV